MQGITILALETPKTQKEKASTLRYNNISLLKLFRRFLTCSSCRL